MKTLLPVIALLLASVTQAQTNSKVKSETDAAIRNVEKRSYSNMFSIKTIVSNQKPIVRTYQYLVENGKIVKMGFLSRDKDIKTEQVFYLKKDVLVLSKETVIQVPATKPSWTASYYFSKNKLAHLETPGNSKSRVKTENELLKMYKEIEQEIRKDFKSKKTKRA